MLSNETPPTLAERLGYDRDAKLLIIHADDLGMCHSINEATFQALDQTAVTSASVMVPCPWFEEVVEYVRTHSGVDVGVHLTITSEWKTQGWRPVSPVSKVRSLINEHGYFWSTSDQVVSHADPVEVEIEIMAQIDRAMEKGVRPTHLDSHMFALLQTDLLLDVFARVARYFTLPLRARLARAKRLGNFGVLHLANVLLDEYFQATVEMPSAEWAKNYEQMIHSIGPGLNELIVHLGIDNQELRALMETESAWGAAWRQRDFELVTSQHFKGLLRRNNIHPIRWKDLRELVWPARAHTP